MAKNTTLAAGTSPFAHLLGGAAALAGRTLGRRAQDEEEQPDAEDEGDEPDAEDEDTDEPETGKRGKRGKKADADDDDDDVDAEDEGDEPDAEDEDADEPEGKRAATPYNRGYAAANKRARAIFASPAAAGRPDLAAQLAFETTMTSAEAIGVLGMASASTATRGRSLDDRMAGRREARPGAGTGASGEKSFGDQVLAASKKAGRRA